MTDYSPGDQTLLNVAYHVFLPPKLPQKAPSTDFERHVNYHLAKLALDAVNKYRQLFPGDNIWPRISRSIFCFQKSILNPIDKSTLERDMLDMLPDDILVLHIREQNAAVIVRKTSHAMTFEIFEAQAPNASVMSTAGKLVRHYPGPAIEIPDSNATDPKFIHEIANFLSRMDVDVLAGATAKSTKAGSKVAEVREAANPHYISQLFTGILRAYGKEIEPRRVAKRIADEVLWDSAYLPWRRSPVWLIIRVLLHTTLEPSDYKHLMVLLHAQILGLSTWDPLFSSDLLATMRIKMARRMLKVKTTLPDWIIQAAKRASDQTEALLRTRWRAIQSQAPHFGPLTLDLTRSTHQTLPNSRPYLDRVLQGRAKRTKPRAFIPSTDTSTRLAGRSDLTVFADGALTRSFDQHKHVALFDFEQAVHHHLPEWVNGRLFQSSHDACAVISSCLDQYMEAALSCYTQDVADTSIMALVILELWMGLDRLVASQHTLLLEYSPEIPANLVEVLLLRSSLHQERARVVQAYIRNRHTKATRGSTFSSKNDLGSFPIQFFRRSSALQQTKRIIEWQATLNRDQKQQELERLNAEHARLTELASMTNCVYTTNKKGHSVHARGQCDRCKFLNRAAGMKIEVHEWPLPANQLDAEAVVFELRCPESFDIWRSVTHKVLCDLAGADRGGKAEHFGTLADYDGLRAWARQSKYRVTIATSSKSFRKSHYATTKIPSTSQAVCVNNALNFRLFDSQQATWANGPLLNASLSKYGTFVIAKTSPYHYLQYALEGTAHTSNQVIANQSDCPKDLSLHEHYAFGTLRSGPRLQWMNIVRGLEENLLSFGREEVYMLHTQAAWQLGPFATDSTNREWHLELNSLEFRILLIRQATRVLDRVRANWLESTTVHTIVMLVARLLSSNPDEETRDEALAFLRDARSVTFRWIKELAHKLQNTEVEIQDFQQRVCEMALICRSTYDIDASHLHELLSTPRDWVDLIVCSIILYDNRFPDPSSAPPHIQTLLARDRRLAFKIVPILFSRLRENPRIVDSSLSQYWSSYRPGICGWTAVGNLGALWITTRTMNDATGNSQLVHLNLMEGRLLVDGQPFGRLPPEYVSHPTYKRLFGQKVLDVVPAHSPGMLFTTRTIINDHQISFSLDASKDLVIQASRGDETFELIPHSKFVADLPAFFSSEYHHWMDLGTGVIEFRSLGKPWVSEQGNWRLQYSSTLTSTMKMTTTSGSSFLINMHSAVFQQISAQIAPLESSEHLHITQSDASVPGITVELPRMELTFFVNENMQLESHNFRKKVIDTNQSSGTLFGLKNQLVLCAKDSVAQSLPRSRSVLIPYGDVEFVLRSNHAQVTINRGPEPHATFYHYEIDTDMGYIANANTSLTGRLFKIYLHALTSHCLPDPLTGRTGTEEALHELDEAATTSFDQIDEEQARLIQLIGHLTPKRVYYPAHLKSMQTTKWADLPPLAQHYAFCKAANSILERAQALQLFNPLGFDVKLYRVERDRTLSTRAECRTNHYYPPNSAGRFSITLENSRIHDESYDGRDHLSKGWTEDGQRASWAAVMVNRNWNKPFKVTHKLVALFEKWNQIHGPGGHVLTTYSQEWLGYSLPAIWLSLYDTLRTADSRGGHYGISVCLAAGIYSGWLPMELVPVLVAFAVNPRFRRLAPPEHPNYRLSDKYGPSMPRILAIVNSHCRSIEASPSGAITKERSEPKATWRQRRKAHYDSNVSQLKPQLAAYWTNCWPDGLTPPTADLSPWFKVTECLTQVQAYYNSCLKNIELRTYLHEVQSVLSSAPTALTAAYASMPRALAKPTVRFLYSAPLPSFDTLIKNRGPGTLLDPPQCGSSITVTNATESLPDTRRLKSLLNELRAKCAQPLRSRYVSDLEASCLDLNQTKSRGTLIKPPSIAVLEQNRSVFKRYLDSNHGAIISWLGPTTELEKIAQASGIWPRLTPRFILGKLALKSRRNIPARQMIEFVNYARSYIEYQRSQRLVRLALGGKHEELYTELKLASSNWDEESYHPDWLLVQIDGNFASRTVQTQVAREMIAPSTEKNTVLQLNMGEGKSSVIVPIVAATLADTTHLARVVVLKPLWRQMFHLLVNRLSGLVNRRIYYLPFGRHIRVGEPQAEQIQEMYEECMREGGILLVQPEHILSFKLMGVDQLLSASTPQELAASAQLQSTENWLFDNARDILDESDEILHVRYQLVYTVGEQQSLEGHPDRWTTTQQVLSLVASHMDKLKEEHPDKLKVETRSGGQFPFIRIMPESDEVVAKLISAVAKDAISGGLPNLNFGILPRAMQNMAFRLLTNRRISSLDTRLLGRLDTSMRGGLLLLRGLLAYGIITFALRDRHYRVDYGLHLSRCLLAVPFQAKDIPSPRAEFGHPEVAIVLTCLSYYYSGLTSVQLETCFDMLFKLDNPELEYEQWVARNEGTPPNLHQLKGVNLKDREQFVNQIIPAFAYNATVIDFFLSSVVFPKEAKQFPHKLSTSGWDLAEVRNHVTTGFSGTNDNRYLLPSSISQSDPVKQSSTNALVLTHLLRPENNHYLCVQGADRETCSAKEFMNILVKQKPEIRVLLDVGAQMLEMTNVELVRYWLSLRPDVAAAAYFNDKDELVILPQHGSPVAFHSSPFAQQMDKCIVYLDDGHTRGTDLKLPKGTRAAVTLGPKVTKDRVLQGCMRMRQLGSGQFVMFFAPNEIDAQIRKVGNLTNWSKVDTLDVLRWAMVETCQDLEHHISHWVQQGVEHDRRANSMERFAVTASRDALQRGWMIPEARSLQTMYGANADDEEFTAKAFSNRDLRLQLEMLGIRSLKDPGMDEEQEREREREREQEVNHEIDRQRQVQRPAKLRPMTHSVHPEIQRFVQTGSIISMSQGIVPLFQPLQASGALQVQTWSPKLFASSDFCKTVTINIQQCSDYMRPVNWILSGPDGIFVVLSPYEANHILPMVRRTSHVRLHVFTPRTAQNMLSFSDLRFYSPSALVASPSLPPPSSPEMLLQLQLSLFAGQLYFDTYTQYRTLCGFLGIFMGINIGDDAEDIRLHSDGFISEDDRRKLIPYVPEYKTCGFKESPVAGLKDLLGYRRKGMEFLRTHTGQILHARQLKMSDFKVLEEPKAQANSNSVVDSLGCVIA